MRAFAVAFAILLVPGAWATGSARHDDAEDDASSSAFLLIGRCRDPSLDVVESGFTIGEQTTTLWYRVLDAQAPFHCDPQHFETAGFPWKRDVFRVFHLYTAGYHEGQGSYLYWGRDSAVAGGDEARIFNGSFSGTIAVEEQLVGNTWTLMLPSSGVARSDQGTTVPYALHGPATYYGLTRGHYDAPTFAVSREDRFGMTFGT